MPEIIEITNPLNPAEGLIHHQINTNTSFRKWLSISHDNIFAIKNGYEFPQDEWDELIRDDDKIYFYLTPGYEYAIYIIVAIIAAVVATAMMPEPEAPDSPKANQAYSINAQSNQARLGSPIAISYGRNRVYPSLLAQPYKSYIGHDEYLYQLFDLGIGEYETEELMIDDTPISNFSSAKYEYYYNQPVTLFPSNVVTSVEVNSQEITTNYLGPYVANPAGSIASEIAVDISWPRGLYRRRKSGGIAQLGVSLLVEYRMIDDLGNTIGNYEILFNGDILAHRNDPMRYSFSKKVASGRYEVRLKYTSTPDSNNERLIFDAQWVGLRTFLPSDTVYTDRTVLAVKVKATNSVTEQSQFKFNVVCTRKLPIYNMQTQQWSAPTATENPAWAICDALINTHTGNRSVSELDLPAICQLADEWDQRGDTFSHIFDSKITLWNAIKQIGMAGRAFPLLQPGLISYRRTKPQTLPRTLFNHSNIIKNSLKAVYSFKTDETVDSIEVEYINPTTWQTEPVLCQPAGTANKTKKVRLIGCHNRAQAFREGQYLAEAKLKQTITYTFQTDLEGRIVQRGDLILIATSLFDLNQGGEIVTYNATTLTLTLSEAVQFKPGLSHVIGLRKQNGDYAGAFLVTVGSHDQEVILNAPLPFTPYTGSSQHRSLYIFGPLTEEAKRCIVQTVTSTGNNRLTITAVNEAPTVHTVETQPVPDLIKPLFIQNDSGPVIEQFIVETSQNPLLFICGWSVAPGALHYVLEHSVDNTNWITVTTTTETTAKVDVQPGDVYLRVRAVGKVAGPWVYWSGVSEFGQLTTPVTAEVYFNPNVINSVRVKINYDTFTDIVPDGLAIFYSYETEEPNTFPIREVINNKIYVDESKIAFDFQKYNVLAGSTQTKILMNAEFSTDYDVAGRWWAAVEGPGATDPRFIKVDHNESNAIILTEPLGYDPATDMEVTIIEVGFHDIRPLKLGVVNSGIDYEVIEWNKIKSDSAGYYAEVVNRAAEGSGQLIIDGLDFEFYPGPGAGSKMQLIPWSSFNAIGNDFIADVNIDIEIPVSVWVSMTCCTYKEVAADPQFLRSHIIPLRYISHD